MGKQKQTVSQFLCILISAYIVHSSSYLSASKHVLNCLHFALFVQPWSLYEPSDGPLWLLPHCCLLPLAPHSCCDVYRHTCILVKAVGTWDDFFFYIFFVFKVNNFFSEFRIIHRSVLPACLCVHRVGDWRLQRPDKGIGSGFRTRITGDCEPRVGAGH